MPTTRRFLDLSPAEMKAMRAHADELGVSVSALGRQWIEDFVDIGSTLPPKQDRRDRVQIIVDSDLLAQAIGKAQANYAVGLSEILRHNISALTE